MCTGCGKPGTVDDQLISTDTAEVLLAECIGHSAPGDMWHLMCWVRRNAYAEVFTHNAQRLAGEEVPEPGFYLQ